MKTIVKTLALLLCAEISHAQYASIGLTLGVGHSWMTNTSQNIVYNPSYNVGASFLFANETKWGYAVDVRYAVEGMKYTYTAKGITHHYGLVSEYVRIPFRVYYFFTHSKRAIRPKIGIGPSVGFLVGGRTRQEDYEGVSYLSKTKDAIHSFDAGLQGSFGIDFRIGHDIWLTSEIAYYNGLFVQNKTGAKDMKNRNAILNMGLTFDL